MESYFVYMVSRIALALMRGTPRHSAYCLLNALAKLAYRIDKQHRAIARVNLRIAFPELSDAERDRIGCKSFQCSACNLLELSRFSLLSKENISTLVEYDSACGLNNLAAARARGRGILYITGHFSAWELLPAAHALYGYPLSFITRPLDNKYLENYLCHLRQSPGNRVLSKKNSARQILAALYSGGSVGLLMDQNTSTQEGIFSPLFGLPATTTPSAAIFALRTQATVLPGYLTPMRNYRYKIKFLAPVDLISTGDRNLDIAANTRKFNEILEKIIKEQPESWLWGHKRWKYQPWGNPQDLYGLPADELEAFLANRSRLQIT